MVAQNVSRCKEKIEQQQFLCLQDKEKVVQMLVRKPPYFSNWSRSNAGLWVRLIFFPSFFKKPCKIWFICIWNISDGWRKFGWVDVGDNFPHSVALVL